MTYASGTWTLSQAHERMIKTAQRTMLRFIVQTKRRYKMYEKKETKEKSSKGTEKNENDSLCATDEEIGDGSERN